MNLFLFAAAVASDVGSLSQLEPRQPDSGFDQRRLFVFHTGSYNSSGSLNASAWRGYPWPKIHTVLIYSQHPDMVKHARASGANVAITTGTPSDLSNATARKQSINDVISQCKARVGCNSINLDIERKAAKGSGVSHDITTYIAELRTAVTQSGETWALIYDAAARPGYEGRNYDYKGLSRSIDWFFVMDYDLNDYDDLPPWNDGSMANSPAPVVMQGLQELLEVIPAEKVVVGLPFYGYEYKGFLGKLPTTSREIGVHEISPMLRDPSWEHRFDNASHTPYITRGKGLDKTQVWYDDPSSIAAKVSMSRALGIWLSGCWTGNALDYSNDAPMAASLFWDALYG